MNDRRASKTENSIKTAFFHLMKKDALNKITVSDICKKADIGRGTFYLHYDDVYDLYENIENELFATLVDIFDSAFPTTKVENSEKLTKELTSYIEKNKGVFKILIRSDNGNSMYKLKKLFYQKVFAEDSKILLNKDDYYNMSESIFVVSGIIGILEKWISDGFQKSAEEVASVLNDIVIKINKN